MILGPAEVTGSQYVDEGEPIEITCYFILGFAHSIHFYKTDKLIHADHTHKISVHQETDQLTIAKLKISSSIKEDDGEYICQAESDFATQIGTFNIEVRSNNVS